MTERLNTTFSTIKADFETVKGSRGSIYFDKNNEIAIFVLKAEKISTQNFTEIMFNAKNINILSKGKRTEKFKNIFLAIFIKGELKIMSLNKLLKSVVPETLISAIEKSERHSKKTTKSKYHIIKYYYHAGFIEVDRKKFWFAKEPVAESTKSKFKPSERSLNTKTIQRSTRKQKQPRKQENPKPVRQNTPDFHMSWKRKPAIRQESEKSQRLISIYQAGIRILLSTG